MDMHIGTRGEEHVVCHAVSCSDEQASGFWASGGLKSSIFQNFKLRAGSGRAKFALVRQSAGIYVLT